MITSHLQILIKLQVNFFLADIGANLTDTMYQGIYNGIRKHEPDLNIVLNRAFMKNVDKLILTGTDVELSEICLKIAKNYSNKERF